MAHSECAFSDTGDITTNKEAIQGLCLSMCPQEEVDMRVRESMVHALEAGGRLVKRYGRSAADRDMARPRLLRPFPALRDTVEYLLLELCEHPMRVYDPVLNKKYLLECLQLILNCYDEIYDEELAADVSELGNHGSLDKKVTNEEVDQLAATICGLELKDQSKTSEYTKLSCDRVLMESLYILCNLGDTNPLMRYHQLPKDLRSHRTLALAYEVAVENMRGNYVAVVKLSTKMCPLTFCAYSTYLPVLQKKALLVLSHAYNSTQLSVPCQAVRKWLSYNSDADVLEAVKHYGLKVTGDSIHFRKADFNKEAAVLIKKNLQKKMDLSIVRHVFSYETTSV
ncbi:uncharacterized protein LOC105382933 isoform X2 [Plutella xylostella]|uniref:uncharacterized protein LOC105382933 isoform X2 n=1 Tax=Plutella xylostella TaxID=51655 RepID=UPI002032F8FB|nr:uncharacterized protein LOC105382933 isoform X2 [Plutella xylostella]